MKSFKFLTNNDICSFYELADITIEMPRPRRMSGTTIARELVSVRPMNPPRSEYINVTNSTVPNYNTYVNNVVKDRMRSMIYWRGFQDFIQENNQTILLTIEGGMNMGGWMHLVYSVTRNGVGVTRHTSGFAMSDIR